MTVATFDGYIQDVLFALPTFESATGVQPTHLTRDPRMSKAMITRLMLMKLQSESADRRALTLEINRTLEFIESQPGVVDSAPRTRYSTAIANLAADSLSLYEVVCLLSLQARRHQVPSRIRRNGLCAAIYLGEDSALQYLSEATTGASVQAPRLFGDPLLIAARAGRGDILSRLLPMEAETLPGRLMSLRVLNALEQAAAAGLLTAVRVLLQLYVTLPQVHLFYDCAIKSNLWASQEEVVMLLLLHRTTTDSQTTPAFQSIEEVEFWRELLQTASSTNCERIATYILGISPITNSICSLNLPLDDACCAGHTNIARLLLSRCSTHNLTSYTGAVFWAARNRNRGHPLSVVKQCSLR